jgi:hypothetical protein
VLDAIASNSGFPFNCGAIIICHLRSRWEEDLQELEIGVILGTEQNDVRRVLLADSPFAPTAERRYYSHFRFSSFDFRISL